VEYEVTLMKVGHRGYTGDFITQEAIESAQKRFEKKPLAGIKKTWIDGDELKAIIAEPIELELPAPFGTR
jgi:hypothetical protein